MVQMTLKLNGIETLELDINDKLIFTGINQDIKWRIYQLIKRYSASSSYDCIEEEYFGQEGINLSLNSKKINLKNTKFICIDQFQDLMAEFEYSRGTLFYQHVEYLNNDFEIVNKMHEIGDKILELENILDMKTKEWSDTFRFHLNPLNFFDLIKKNMSFTYLREEKETPYYCLTTSDYLDELIRLIDFQIERTGNDVWLVLYDPESIINAQSLQYLVDESKRIAEMTGRLKLIMFHQVHITNYSSDDLSDIVICTDKLEQFPNFQFLKASIERHYPENLNMKDSELVLVINRVLEFIGAKSSKETSLSLKDMVLLKVLNELVGCRFEVETSNIQISQSELRYLTSVD